MNKSFFTLLVCFFTLLASEVAVAQTVTVNARVYLQGALYNNDNAVGTHGRPLMRDDLRSFGTNNENFIPATDVYQYAHQVNQYVTTDVTAYFTHVGCGAYPQFQVIPNPTQVFGQTGDNAIVDWVFVELRYKNDNTGVAATRSGLLQRDGDIVDLDGISALEFPDLPVDDYYVVIRHRNHLGIMTKFPQTPSQLATLVDFTHTTKPLYDMGMYDGYNFNGQACTTVTLNNFNYNAMIAGDLNCDGKVKTVGKFNDLDELAKLISGFDLNMNPDGNINYLGAVGYLQSDLDMNGNAKFNNPFDDRNKLYAQTLLYELNDKVLVNFDYLLEQLPK